MVILNKMNIVIGMIIIDFKLYYINLLIKILWFYYRNRYIN